MTLTIGLFGTGRLGSAIRAAAALRDDVEVTWSVGRGTSEGAPGRLAGLPPVEVAIDVSHADTVAQRLSWARTTGTALVIGTTGWDPHLVDEAACGEAPVLIAPNFALGVALVRRLAGVLGGYAATAPVPVDLAISETHHRGKVDSPSGTALSLREALATGAGREATAIQTTSLRVGSVIGDHEVLVASELETISVRHVAHDRSLFAHGALAAARWLATRPAGLHTLDDLAEDALDSLLRPSSRHPAPSVHHPDTLPAPSTPPKEGLR